MIIKPNWKLDAEKAQTSLPGFWTGTEIARYFGVSQSYISRLIRDKFVDSYKIGTVFLVNDKEFERLTLKIEKR